MRLLIVAALTLGMGSSVLAQTPLESCSQVPALAADVMTGRQINYDIMLMLNKMNGDLNDQPELLTWAQAMVDMAYSEAVPATKEARARQVEDFQKLWLDRCLARKK